MTTAEHPATPGRRVPERRRTGFWLLLGLLALSGVSMAFIVIFGFFDSTAYSIVWRVFVADLYLIASFAAQHRWLRLTAWIGTGITFVIGLVNAFWQYTPYYRWAGGRASYTVGDEGTGWSPWFGFEQDLEAAAHLLLVTVLVLGFVSLAHRWIVGERVLHGIYVFTFIAALTAALIGAMLILDSPFRWDIGGDALGKVAAGISILALTGAAIVTIAAFVQRKAARARAAAEHRGERIAAAVTDHLAAPGPAQAGASGAASPAGRSDAELRELVRGYVDEYLRERGI
jgi:hypothetical protein